MLTRRIYWMHIVGAAFETLKTPRIVDHAWVAVFMSRACELSVSRATTTFILLRRLNDGIKTKRYSHCFQTHSFYPSALIYALTRKLLISFSLCTWYNFCASWRFGSIRKLKLIIRTWLLMAMDTHLWIKVRKFYIYVHNKNELMWLVSTYSKKPPPLLFFHFEWITFVSTSSQITTLQKHAPNCDNEVRYNALKKRVVYVQSRQLLIDASILRSVVVVLHISSFPSFPSSRCNCNVNCASVLVLICLSPVFDNASFAISITMSNPKAARPKLAHKNILL